MLNTWTDLTAQLDTSLLFENPTPMGSGMEGPALAVKAGHSLWKLWPMNIIVGSVWDLWL